MTQKAAKQFSPEWRGRAVRIVQDREREGGTQWELVGAIAAKVGGSRETLRRWVGPGERDAGERPGLTTVRSGTDQGFGAGDARTAPGQREPAQSVGVFCRR